jgi:hypothetical protein
MSEITKTKQKNSVDLSQGSTTGPKHEVNIGGLMRSPPLGGFAKPLSVGGLPAGFSSGLVSKGRSESVGSQDSKTTSDKAEPDVKTSPASGKPKPAPPPAKDLRAGLKSRQGTADSDKKGEPEFKSVFGQLRRTQTQNYVAPDELKNNITKGKAALNITGGPKKTERKDEFKDAILKKKEDFKKAQQEGKGVTRAAGGGAGDAPLPEALMKRNALGRSGSVVSEQDVQQASIASPPKESPSANQFQGKDAAGGKLAGRLNPALAGLLARGPPSASSDSSRSASLGSSQRTVSMTTSTTNPDTQEPGPTLIHMTKGRARGPRRKAPTTVATPIPTPDDVASSKSLSEPKPNGTIKSSTPEPLELAKPTKPSAESSSQVDSERQESQPSSPQKLNLKRRSQFLQESSNKNSGAEAPLRQVKPLSPEKKLDKSDTPRQPKETEVSAEPAGKIRPESPIKSPSLVKHTGKSSRIQQVDSPEISKSRGTPLSSDNNKGPKTPPKTAPTPVKSNRPVPGNGTTETKTIKGDDQDAAVSVKNAAASWQQPGSSGLGDDRPKVRSPIKLPTRDDEKAAMIEAGLRPSSPQKGSGPVGLGIKIVRDKASQRPLPTPPAKSLPSLPPTTEAGKLLFDFFGHHGPPPEFAADTAAILAARQDQGTDIKTLRSTLYLFSSDGKKQLVASHHERLLFEGNMYICVHVFGNAAGKKVTEVYFWAGDEVPTSTVQGADIFAQREAKAAGGKLVKIQQGKETPEFFHALGGILIIRRGLSNKYDSLAPHILCGRKYLGQIAFDEIDYSPNSLCSGFPYLISTQSGKSYLWKGKGSGIDELSCARLIGMDLGLTGDIEEIEDGNEPASFLEIFGTGAKIPKSADHWRLKPNYNKYCGRLFRADSSNKSQVC